jgi:ribosomal-protein-alanine N-acetyltransferase
MLPPPVITTERLVLRLAERSDVPALRRFSVENAAHLAPTSPAPAPDVLTEAYWLRQVEQGHGDFAQGRAARCVLFPRDAPDIVVGRVSLTNIVRGVAHYGDLGYSLAADRQGQGLMSEAVAAAIRYAFDDLRLHRVKAAYVPTNGRSGRLLRRLGFVAEGYARDSLLIQGRWQNQVLVELTNPEQRAPG